MMSIKTTLPAETNGDSVQQQMQNSVTGYTIESGTMNDTEAGRNTHV